ncbi:MAG: pyrroline-5-carboxylate reductase [Candidatus Margulisbacteria bacterium]|nr:pyrroline-5-carboxylate reductase [Candidatus Margulisiibacteriota bacterium]MBU1021315.1 pyrroline-5-carboxylate reductase [Candidatus Margulisiibacteriota bacterium]MBU1729196.1 pyrroline-5-carboxylate reductase [Candidatus Margulisiibacteriota bacterium]MBU1954869.1 pyrroline-5-carboxylate reductase [Candidatus Margulisiibacteriota bacterium]
MEIGKIGVIGAGRMGQALISGLTASLVSPADVIVFDVDKSKLADLTKLKVKIAESSQAVVTSSDIILLAVKPQAIDKVLAEIKTLVSEKQVVVSIAAGITLTHLSAALKTKKIFRVMPNNPSLVGAGMAAISGLGKEKSDNAVVTKIFEAVGAVVFVEEKMMDAVTGLSGSGPAFVYLFIRSLIAAGKKLGLDEKTAKALALQTVAGSVAVLQKTKIEPTKLIDMVKSPGGTTIEGLKVLEEGKFQEMVVAAVAAASRRSQELSQ